MMGQDLKLSGVELRYPGLAAPALAVPALHVRCGEQVAIMGPSGAGKTTLAGVLAGLERPQAGSVRWGGVDIAALSEGRRDAWRAAHVGLVMQDFRLFPGLSALDNVLLPHGLRHWRIAQPVRSRALALLAAAGLPRPDQRIETMSRGELQRVAVARALLGRPTVVVADEPTASLDQESAAAVAGLLLDLSAQVRATLLVVTHDSRLAGRLSRRIVLESGRVAAPVQAAAA